MANGWELAAKAIQNRDMKIRRKAWPESFYVYFSDERDEWLHNGFLDVFLHDFYKIDWEEYKPEVIKVKMYLPKIIWREDVKRPEAFSDELKPQSNGCFRREMRTNKFFDNKNLENWFTHPLKYKVLEWHEIEVPERWEDAE
jgi:hypothetical protein